MYFLLLSSRLHYFLYSQEKTPCFNEYFYQAAAAEGGRREAKAC
jgi:hypothetical protein